MGVSGSFRADVRAAPGLLPARGRGGHAIRGQVRPLCTVQAGVSRGDSRRICPDWAENRLCRRRNRGRRTENRPVHREASGTPRFSRHVHRDVPPISTAYPQRFFMLHCFFIGKSGASCDLVLTATERKRRGGSQGPKGRGSAMGRGSHDLRHSGKADPASPGKGRVFGPGPEREEPRSERGLRGFSERQGSGAGGDAGYHWAKPPSGGQVQEGVRARPSRAQCKDRV